MTAPALSIRALSMGYADAPVLDRISLDLPAGEVLALLGPSGCGKTTLLRLIAGLLQPDAGEIEIAGRPVADPAAGLALPPEKRGLGMVFQDYALWPHLSVARNVAFPLEMTRVPRPEREARVRAALERVGLGAMAERRPSDLSGGQQQRVAIARAIVAEPPLVLFDEPLSNLDRDLREQMVDELSDLIADLRLSAVYVTHDHAEALSLAHRIAVLRGGGIEQMADPLTLVTRPASVAAAAFLRLGCILPALRGPGGWSVPGAGIALPHPPADAPLPAGAGTACVLLPERALRPGDAGPATLACIVARAQVRGAGHALTLHLPGVDGAEIRILSPLPARPGDVFSLSYSPDLLRWLPPAP